MNLQEVQSCKCTPQVHIPFSTCWSDDNYIAMATDKGIYSVEFLPSSQNKRPDMGIRRNFLETPKYLPAPFKDIDTDRLISSLDATEFSQLLMDDAMAVSFKEAAFTVVVRQLAWAKFEDHLPRSLLTVLTNSGGLCLYRLFGSEWVEEYNISKLWYEKSALLWDPLPSNPTPRDLLKILKERSHRLKITAFTWTGTKSTTNLLFTASWDGTLCAWEVSCDVRTGKIDVELLRGLQTRDSKITSLTIIQTEEYKCLLLYSVFSGQIQAIPVTITDVVEFHEPVDVWEDKDGIVVPAGGMEAEIVLGYVILTVAKGSHLLVFLITSECQVLSYTAMNTGEVAVTGFHYITPTELFLTTWSGKINLISVGVESDASIKLEITPIEGLPKTENLGIMGAAFSKSKSIIALSYNVKVNFNHLAIREVSKLSFCVLPEFSNPIEKIRSHTGPLMNIWDALEVTRIGFLKKPEKDLSLLNTLVDCDQFDSMDITQLKKNLWFLDRLLSPELGRPEELDNYKELGKEIYNLITAHHVFKRCSTLLAADSPSPQVEESLDLMKNWILFFESNLDSDNYPSTQGILTVILDQLKARPGGGEEELCKICGSGPEESPQSGELKNWRCFQGHELPRCSISFLQCDDIPPYVCKMCDLVACTTAVETEGYCRCVYCDGYLEKPESMSGSRDRDGTPESDSESDQ